MKKCQRNKDTDDTAIYDSKKDENNGRIMKNGSFIDDIYKYFHHTHEYSD